MALSAVCCRVISGHGYPETSISGDGIVSKTMANSNMLCTCKIASSMSKKAQTVKSIFITDSRSEGGLGMCTYVHELDMTMVPACVCGASMVLEGTAHGS